MNFGEKSVLLSGVSLSIYMKVRIQVLERHTPEKTMELRQIENELDVLKTFDDELNLTDNGNITERGEELVELAMRD